MKQATVKQATVEYAELASFVASNPEYMVTVEEIVNGSCADFVVSVTDDPPPPGSLYRSQISWFGVPDAPLLFRTGPGVPRSVLKALEQKYGLESKFTDKEHGLGFSCVLAGDGEYGRGPGKYSMFVSGVYRTDPKTFFPAEPPFGWCETQDLLSDTSLVGLPLAAKTTLGSLDLDSLMSMPSLLNSRYPRKGLRVNIINPAKKTVRVLDFLNPAWTATAPEEQD